MSWSGSTVMAAGAAVLRARFAALSQAEAEALTADVLTACLTEAESGAARDAGPDEVVTPEGRPAHIVLGVAPNASRDEITAARRARALLCHPDLGGSTAMMAEVNAAADAMLLRARP